MSAKRILLVEDEALIAMMVEDMLEELGLVLAAHVTQVDQALMLVNAQTLEDPGFDGAILDVNLDGEKVWPVAERLHAIGVPFILSSGASEAEVPALFADVPSLLKPYTFETVKSALEDMLGLGRKTGGKPPLP